MNHTLYRLCIGVLVFCMGCCATVADSRPMATTAFTGRLTIYAVDNFKEGISQTRYVMKIEERGMVSLHFADQTDVSKLRTGMHLKVFGRQQNGYIDVAHFKIISVPSK